MKLIKFLWEQPVGEAEDEDTMIEEMECAIREIGFELDGNIITTRIEEV